VPEIDFDFLAQIGFTKHQTPIFGKKGEAN
jgi:hypothetical protein